jgi:hypothetical protein
VGSVGDWYGQQDAWISSSNGPPLTITGSFAPYTLTAAAPPRVLFARLFVRTGRNSREDLGRKCLVGPRSVPDFYHWSGIGSFVAL